MKKKIKNTLSLWSLIIILFAAPVHAQEVFEQITTSLENDLVFKADFKHDFVDVFTLDTVRTTGTILINAEGYKLEVPERTIVIQDSLSRVYNRANNQVITSDYNPEDDDFAPSRLIYASQNDYVINQKAIPTGFVVSLDAKDPFAMFGSVLIYVSKSGLPTKIEAIDQGDNMNVTEFTQGEFIASSRAPFDLDYPEDAEIIDLRN